LRLQVFEAFARDPLLVLDGAGRIGYWNEAAEAAFGYSRREMLGRPVEAILPMAPGQADGRRTLETVLRRKDGIETPVEIAASPVRVRGRLRTAVSVRDVSDRRRREEELRRAKERAEKVAAELEAVNKVLEQTTVWANEMAAQTAMANAAKSEFLASMSHEIRTPMNGVLGMLTLLEQTDLSREQLDYVETIRYSGEILLNIINQILDFSRIESGKLELETVEFDPRHEVEQAVLLFAERAEAKGLELLTTISEAVPPRLRGDPGRFRQILINLLGNAVKFTGKGEVSVAVAGGLAGGNRVELRVEVRDTGIGMEPAVVQKLFQAFYQGEGDTRRKFGGTGLGLAICKKLVEAMHGSIEASSTPGAGSIFRFTVQVEAVPGAAAQPDLSGEALRGKRVLVANRNAAVRELIRSLTSAWGMEDSERDGSCDFVIADASDPDLERLRQICRRGSGGPALLLLASRSERQTAETLGAAALIVKPVRAAKLREALLQFSQPLEPAAASLAVLSRALTTGAGQRILIAEDNLVNQKVARKLVERLGYLVEIADDGEAAVRAAAEGGYAAVLMDCQMPVMDGFKSTQAIRRLPEPRSLVPIIAMTANAVKGDREKCLAAGMSDYLSKPVNPLELKAALERWCGKTHPVAPHAGEPEWEAFWSDPAS
jgi:two-component system sensor histidine kinase/response regulator